MSVPRSRRLATGLAVLALVAAACGTEDGGQGGGQDPQAQPTAPTLQAQVASFDLATGQDQRLLVGLIDGENGVLGGGEVEVRVGFLGEQQAPESDEIVMSDPVTASFLPVPGSGAEGGDAPEPLEKGAGVYQAEVDLDRAGFWGVQVATELDGEAVTATATFPVDEEHKVPAVGDEAPRTETPTVDSEGVDPVALDSRAQGDTTEVPDPSLHQASVAEVLDEGRPMVVAITTPTYCQSQFCGPITEYVEELAGEYDDRAEFIHLEVWEDFEAEELNDHVEEWIFDPETGGNEPWVFLVGADGTIQARWGNVLDGAELEAMLEELPAG